MKHDDTSMLQGYRVLDLTTEIGRLCGKVLGNLGADVMPEVSPELQYTCMTSKIFRASVFQGS